MPTQAEIEWWKKHGGFRLWTDLSEEEKADARKVEDTAKLTDETLNHNMWRLHKGEWQPVDIDQVKKVMSSMMFGGSPRMGL